MVLVLLANATAARAAEGRSTAAGDVPAVPAMTLSDALAYARAHQPSLRGAVARLAAAAADTHVAWARWLPTVGATAQGFLGTENNSSASYLGAPDVDIPRIGGTRVGKTWSPSISILGAVGAGQEVFDFGRIAAEAAVADAAELVERQRADAERLRIDLVVRDAFYGVLGAHAVLRAADDARDRARGHRDLAAAEVKSGLQPPIELTRAEADLARFEVDHIRAEGGVRSAEAVLAAAVGLETGGLLDAAGPADAPAPEPPLAEGLRRALDRDPTVGEARARVASVEAATRSIAAALRPDLALTATISDRGGTATATSGTIAETSGPWPLIPNWDAGLVLRWQILDPMVLARRRASLAREEAARADASAVSQQEAAAVVEAYTALDVARAALTGLERAVSAARANYAQAEARFKTGLGTALELADAEAVRTDAEIQLAIARFQSLRARAVIARLTAEDL
jgi:outer membrane protein